MWKAEKLQYACGAAADHKSAHNSNKEPSIVLPLRNQETAGGVRSHWSPLASSCFSRSELNKGNILQPCLFTPRSLFSTSARACVESLLSPSLSLFLRRSAQSGGKAVCRMCAPFNACAVRPRARVSLLRCYPILGRVCMLFTPWRLSPTTSSTICQLDLYKSCHEFLGLQH